MLAFLRFLFRATLLLTVLVVVLIALYVAVTVTLNRPRPGLHFGQPSPTSLSTVEANADIDDIGSSIEAETEGSADLLNLVIQRYWALKSMSFGFSKTPSVVDDDKFFTPSRLANLSAFNLLRPQAQPSVFRNDDRILAQIVLGMEGLPDSYMLKYKTIVLLGGSGPAGDLNETCPAFKLNACRLIEVKNANVSIKRLQAADAIIVTHQIKPVRLRTVLRLPDSTKLMYFMLESPFVTAAQIGGENDWLNSYWRHSDVVAPYEKWVYYDSEVVAKEEDVDYAAMKTKVGGGSGLAAIFMSNCKAQNSRLQLVNELKKHIPVDVYGKCGDLKCPRDQDSTCFTMLQKNYKFYLAFENANCRDYMTEKFFRNALKNDVVPVVFGAHPNDYRALAPRGSYIHVEDFSSVQELAAYLKFLDGNDEAYNSYFEWKGTGEFIDTKHWCRVCAMMHYADYVKSLETDWDTTELTAEPEPSENEIVYWDTRHECTQNGRVFWNKSRSL